MLSVGDIEYVSIMSSVVLSVCMLLGDVVAVVVRTNPPPLPPFLGGFLVLCGFGQRVVLPPEVSTAISSTKRVMRKTNRTEGMLKVWWKKSEKEECKFEE